MFYNMKEKLKIDMRRVTLKQLRVLAALIKQGTVAKAARSLHVSAPAVSQQLQLLKGVTGMPLVERNEDGLRATEVGQILLDSIHKIELSLIDASDALEGLLGIDAGRLSVGVVSTAKYFAPFALVEFAKKYPNVDIKLKVGNREEIIQAMKNFELDMAITGRPPKDFSVNKAIIGDHPHVIICPTDHPLIERKRLSLADLSEDKFLLREEGSGSRLLMQRLFRKAGLNPNLGMEIGSNETIKQAVMAGLGIALISSHTISAELKDKRLGVLSVSGMPVVRTWYVVKQKSKKLLPAAEAFWEFIAHKGSEFFPE